MRDLVKDFEKAMSKDKELRESIQTEMPSAPQVAADINEMINFTLVKELLNEKTTIEEMENNIISNNNRLTDIRANIQSSIAKMNKDEALQQMAELLNLVSKLDSDMVSEIQRSILEKLND